MGAGGEQRSGSDELAHYERRRDVAAILLPASFDRHFVLEAMKRLVDEAPSIGTTLSYPARASAMGVSSRCLASSSSTQGVSLRNVLRQKATRRLKNGCNTSRDDASIDTEIESHLREEWRADRRFGAKRRY